MVAQACVLLEREVRRTSDLPEVQAVARDCLLALGHQDNEELFLSSGGIWALRTLAELQDVSSRNTAARWMRKMAFADDTRLLKDVGLPVLWRVFDPSRVSHPVVEWWPVFEEAMGAISVSLPP